MVILRAFKRASRRKNLEVRDLTPWEKWERDSMYMIDFEKIESLISESLKLLVIHKKTYQGGVNGGILQDHFTSLKHGLQFLGIFIEVSKNKDFLERIIVVVTYVKQVLYSLTCHRKDESFFKKLEREYAHLREFMKNVVIKPGIEQYVVVFPEILGYDFNLVRLFLCKKIKKLLTSDCKADQITPMAKELEDFRKMLTSLLKPFFIYAKSVVILKKEEEKKIFATITNVIDRATCYIYMSFVGKMDKKMVVSLRKSMSDLIIEEPKIMKMYLIFDMDSNENLESHIYMSMRLLEWNKKCYLGTEMGEALEDHFMSIKQGLKFLVRILKISSNIRLKLRIQHLVSVMKQKLYSLGCNLEDENMIAKKKLKRHILLLVSIVKRKLKRRIHHLVSIVKKKPYLLPHIQKDENLIVKLDHAYGELREEMQSVVIKPGTDDYDTLFPEIFQDWFCLCRTKDFIFEKIGKLVTLRCKADTIAPVMKELEKLRKKLTSLKPLFDYVIHLFSVKEDEEEILVALTTFLDRATCLVYLSFVGELNEDILASLRKNFCLLIEETEIKKMSLVLGIIFEEDIDISLSLLKRQEEYHIGTINEAILKDHFESLRHGLEFLKWIPKIHISRDLKRRIILLVGNAKQILQSLTYDQGGESLNMDVNGAYADLREQMKNLIVNPREDNYDTLYVDFKGNNDFILEKITALLTSNCKAGQIAPLQKELQILQKMLTFLKPLGLYVDLEIPLLGNVFTTLLTFHHKAAFVIYLSFVGKMDIEMVLWVKSDISTAIEETDILKMYATILNEILIENYYLEKEFYLLENLILLLKRNVGDLNDANYKLYELLSEIHRFLLALSPTVILRKLHLLKASFEDILHHSILIVCSCYIEHTEADISTELNCVLDLIKHIKSEVQEIKLYYFPRVDDLGFLEFFSGYLEDLMKNDETSMKEEVNALHFEVHSLLSLAKERNEEELNKTPWSALINMAYQAEYIIDLYLATSSRDSALISSLLKIIEQLKIIRADVHGFSCKSLPPQDVALTSKFKVPGTTTQLSNNVAIVGLQEEAKTIMGYLLNGEKKLDVISLVGMAGVGKTTLAMTVYKTPSMDDHFDILAWCTVSQSYQNRDLLFSILDQVNALDKSHRSILDDQKLADHFCRSLKKRRYLIVLDDIWDTTLWNYLKRYLPDGREGSRVLITTRNWDVADQIGSKVNQLHGLSDENSWELFQEKMIGKESLSDNLQKISKGIVENCKGLPLSIVIIAGILSGIEKTEKKWDEIAKRVNSLVYSDPQGNCKAILELSYNHLPNHLKSCFLYMGLFPEDEEISVKRLITMWIGEGLVRDKMSDRAEEVAKKYMEDLISKSLVIPAKERSGGGVKTFRLHDLLRDFCLDKAKENHFFAVLDKINDSRPLQDPRRIFINNPYVKSVKDFSCHSVRSMICFGELEAFENRIGYKDMALLRVLEAQTSEFPDISSLVHLRYLALHDRYSKISIVLLPICKLQNLKILILRSDYSLIKVPDSIWDMVKLRHVHLSPEASFQVDRSRLENSSFLLENLRSLSNARVSCGDSNWLSKLSGLQELSCVFGEDVLEEDDYYVTVEEYIDDDDDQEGNRFRMFSFNGHLTSLKVRNAASRKQRFTCTSQLPISLRELTLSKFFLTSTDISKIGKALPHLEVFKIYSCHVPSFYEWNMDDEDFPKLKVLKLRSLNISKWIVSEDAFPKLEQLWVEDCHHLDKIPLPFGYLPNLRLISVRGCRLSIDDSAREIEKMQHDEQNTEMRVLIHSRHKYNYKNRYQTNLFPAS